MNKILYLSKDDYSPHYIIYFLGLKIKIRKKITSNDKNLYIDYVLNHQQDKTKYVEITKESHNISENNPKLIALYLPQYHDFPENVKWFGRGFSEWTNTSKTVPQFVGHYQPHIPIDVGYYNLESNNVMIRQIELAKKYGISGFGFYYYWYSGDKIMEKPIERFLADKSLNINFFLFWANEDWTMLWDNGDAAEVLHKQEIKENDAEKFMTDLLPYLKDERYIKINNKPLFVLYDPELYPYDTYINFNKKIRAIAKENGFDDLYIITTTWRADNYKNNYKEFTDKYLLDGLFEFFPQSLHKVTKKIYPRVVNKKFVGEIFDVHDYIARRQYLYQCNTNLFKGIFPNWDNTPRKCYNHAFIWQNNPQDYKVWLKDILNWTKDNKSKEEQYIFINAWNEWAEGAHLEPDKKYGYAYLQATKEALEEYKNG